MARMKFIVTATAIPTNYNRPTSYVVEAGSEKDARAIVKDSLRDFARFPNYVYDVKPYTPPPPGRIVASFL